MIAIIDYGLGNLRSVQKAFAFLGYDAVITKDAAVLKDAGHIVLPGVGAIGDALKNLEQRGLLLETIRQAKSGKPFLGICLGMQLMLHKSYEMGEYSCLGLIKGEVVPFRFEEGSGLRVPHMGWNNLLMKDNPLFYAGEKESYVFFVHSYYASGVPEGNVIGRADYGGQFVCAVRDGNMYGLQFHPEKSGAVGLAMLKNFAELS